MFPDCFSLPWRLCSRIAPGKFFPTPKFRGSAISLIGPLVLQMESLHAPGWLCFVFLGCHCIFWHCWPSVGSNFGIVTCFLSGRAPPFECFLFLCSMFEVSSLLGLLLLIMAFVFRDHSWPISCFFIFPLLLRFSRHFPCGFLSTSFHFHSFPVSSHVRAHSGAFQGC